LVPYLTRQPNVKYTGIDLSQEMIELGRQQHPRHQLIVGSFPDDCCTQQYDVIVFNGSIQFFQNTQQTIEVAASMLKNNGRIVLAHVEGSKFVQQECRSNPKVAVRTMPNSASLQQYANFFKLDILSKQNLLVSSVSDDSNNDANTIYDQEVDGADEQFYLVALAKT
jgi:trans-aconitate methyltransferase